MPLIIWEFIENLSEIYRAVYSILLIPSCRTLTVCRFVFFLLFLFEFSVVLVWHVSGLSLPLFLSLSLPLPLPLFVCVSNACHVTKLYNFETGSGPHVAHCDISG